MDSQFALLTYPDKTICEVSLISSHPCTVHSSGVLEQYLILNNYVLKFTNH